MEEDGEALGQLFKITELFLWDDARGSNSRETHCRDDSSLEESPAPFGFDHPEESCSRNSIQENEVATCLDSELAQVMGALGLPVSFSTNKEKRKISTGRKKQGKSSLKNQSLKLFSLCSNRDAVSSFQDSVSICVTESSSPNHTIELEPTKYCATTTKNCTKGEVDLSYENIKFDVCEEKYSDKVNNAQSTATIGVINKRKNRGSVSSMVVPYPYSLVSEDHDLISVAEACTTCAFDCKLENSTITNPSCTSKHETKKESNEMEVEMCNFSESAESIQKSIHLADSTKYYNCNCPDDLDNWRVVWDTYYMRNYYYNICSEESTWCSPLCLECTTISSNCDEAQVGATEDGTITGLTCKMSENTAPRKLLTMGSLLELEHSDVLSKSDGAYVHANVDGSTLNFTGKAIQDTGPSSVQNLDLFPESNDDITPKLKNEIDNLVSEQKKIFSQSVSLHQSEEHRCDFIQSNIKMASDDDNNAAPKSLASEDSNESVIAELELTSEEIFKSRSNINFVQTDDDPSISVSTKKNMRRIRSRQKIKCSDACESTIPEEMEGFSINMMKYWCQRYLLFSKFDMGVKMDEEGWFSVTPELIARHHAERCRGGTVIDCFAGVGGNAIQFAIKCDHVIAVDIDPCKIDYARHNAAIYGVEDNIDFVQGDFFQLAAKLKGDSVFLSPPWGGPDYVKAEIFDLLMLKPHDGYFLFKIACRVAPRVVMFLPRNVNLNQLAELSQLEHPPWKLEVEKNYLNGKLKAITAYFDRASS